MEECLIGDFDLYSNPDSVSTEGPFELERRQRRVHAGTRSAHSGTGLITLAGALGALTLAPAQPVALSIAHQVCGVLVLAAAMRRKTRKYEGSSGT